ncbi:MAG: phage portal protein [Phycisphaerales bacterium]|jgi:hypothetical protein|nr:phage portal protein [Phycisphaerales bacterium]
MPALAHPILALQRKRAKPDAARSVVLDDALVALLIDAHERDEIPRLEELWTYYRNPRQTRRGASFRARALALGAGLPAGTPIGTQAQEAGLPARLTGARDPLGDDRERGRREVVIENDIAWRVHAMVDFMFGKPVQILSTAPDEAKRARIERALDAAWEASGGIALLQDFALLGHVYGHADLVLRTDALQRAVAGGPPRLRLTDDDAIALARLPRVELIEPTRGVPVMDPSDYRELTGYVVHHTRHAAATVDENGELTRAEQVVTELIAPGVREVWIDGSPASRHRDALLPDRLPVAHVQNLSMPFRYTGLGEVEPLIALQDELNTRLSDRASRVTMQSFKMLLAKGMEGFDRVPIGPGRVFVTDNPDASITLIGGDAPSPSEDAHITEIREAMDKVSTVPPLAGGVVRAKIGNLSSANALRITLMGLLAKTARKRVTYGRGIEAISRMMLEALDRAGVLPTTDGERGLRLQWPDPLPVDLREQVVAAEAKARLGVSVERVLGELGYGDSDAGVQ